MTAYTPDVMPFRKQIFGLWLCVVILLSSLALLNLNTIADTDNVFVSGFVIDSKDGTPIENATIILQSSENGRLNATKSDATGHYDIGVYSSPGGTFFTLSAFHDDYLVNSTYIFLEPSFDKIRDIYLDPAEEKGSHVHGIIYDAVTKAPMPWLGIAAYSETYINTTGANATGYYWMGLQSNQTYLFQVEKNGYETQRKTAYFRWGDNLSMDFLMEPMNCTFKGYINGIYDPLVNASILVYRLGELFPIEHSPQVNTTTGYFELNLSRGVWQAEVEVDNHLTQALTVLMFSGQTTWQNFTLLPIPSQKAKVQGYVRYYENDTGASSCLVSASNSNGTWNDYNLTNSTGWYDLSVIPGEVTIYAWVPGYTSKSFTIQVEEKKTYIINHSVFDPKENAYLDGYVKVNGTGEEGVNVVAYHGWRVYEDKTDITGYYNISIPAAPLDVQAIKTGFETIYAQINSTVNKTTQLNLTLEALNWSSEIRGYVNDTSGDPVDYAYVSIDYDGLGYQSSTVITDYTGFYQGMVPSGVSSYFILPEEHEYAFGELNLPPEKKSWLNCSLEPENSNSEVVFRLLDIYTGEPLEHTKVTITEQDMQWYREVETDSKGMVAADVPSGFVGINFNAYDNGYKNPGMYSDPYRMQFLLKPKEIRWLNISLFPRDKTALISGYVNDTGNNPIPNAMVYAEYGSMIITTLTDGTGLYELKLPGGHHVNVWVRAPGYKIMSMETRIETEEKIWYDWNLNPSGAWIEGPITDSGMDLDGDTTYDFLNVHVTINSSVAGNYMLEGELRGGKTDHYTISSTAIVIDLIAGTKMVTLEFMGEHIWNSKRSGYFVDIQLSSTLSLGVLDKMEYYTTPYQHDEFDLPNAIIEIPVEQWLVDSDYDGFYNYLVLNLSINVSETGEYIFMGILKDIWGDEVAQEMETYKLEAGIKKVQISFKGTAIYNNHEDIGSCYIVMFDELPQMGNEFINSIFFYTPYEYELFQSHLIDTFISGYVTDINDQPIENIDVMLYNITYRYLNSTRTNESGFYELGGWGGEWILVVEDDEDEGIYQGNLTELSLVSGQKHYYNVRNLTYTPLDRVEEHLTFSDWNNLYLNWRFYAVGDNETIRFMMDVLQFGDGDGFLSEEEVEMIVEFISGMSLPENSSQHFLVDGIWYDMDLASETFDVGLVGPVTSSDPIYIHMTGNYSANSTIPNPSPHELTLNCSYDDTDPQSVADNNATFIYKIAVPTGWGRTGNGTTQNVSISGGDYITADPQGDPNESDGNFSEWVNITISSGISPTYCSIRGNVTLQGAGGQGGGVVKVYDNATQQEVASSPTGLNGYYEILGLSPGIYDVVAHKSGYMDNWSLDHTIVFGEVLWLDFTLFSYPPKISHTPVSSVLVGNTIEIYADVTDDGKVESVVLYYKEVSSSSYSNINMSRIAAIATFMGTIPAQSQVGYVYYYIWAEDNKGNNVTHPLTGNHTVYIYELDPPDILNVTAQPNPAESPSFVNVSAEVTDNYGVDSVKLFLERPDLSTSNTTMDYDPLNGEYYLNLTYSLPGVYNFTIWTNDSFDNWNSFSGTFVIQDTIPPVSYIEPMAQYWYKSSPVTVNAMATDSGIGVDEVKLMYRYSKYNSSWSMWTLFGTDTSAPYQWSFDFPDGEGFYEFYSNASDILGNEEATPAQPDTICALDTSLPTFSSFSAVPDPCELGRILDIFTIITDISGIGGAWVNLSYEGSLIGNFSMSNSGQNYWYLYTPYEIGTYDVVLWAVDNNSYWNFTSDSVFTHDTTPPSIVDLAVTPSAPTMFINVRLSVNVSDLSGISNCMINISEPDGDWLLNDSMTNEPGTDKYYFETEFRTFGDYQFDIWVEDGNGLWAKFSDTVFILDSQPPHADAGSPQDVTVGALVTLDARQSSDNDDISNYTWSFYDTGLQLLYGEVTYYAFNNAHDYEITLAVRDLSGNMNTSVTWVNVSAVSITGAITGTVLDENDNPIQGATVYVQGHPNIENVTDSLGRYFLQAVPIGNQSIIVAKEGYKRSSQDVTVLQDHTTTADDIVLAKSAAIEETPWVLFGALGAAIAVCAALLLFFLLKKKKGGLKEETVIDEIFFMTNDGRLIKHFTRRLRPDMDEDILSGMLVAVQDFIKDSFKDREGVLDEMKFGKFQVLLGRGNYIILAPILLGDNLEPYKPQIAKCVEDIEEKFEDVLKDWDGEISKLMGASKYIMDLIEGRYA